MKSVKRLICEKGISLFAPTYFKNINTGKETIIVTAGNKDNRVFGTKKWGNGRVECWYKFGRSAFWLYEKQGTQWVCKTKQCIDTSGFDDVMKISVVWQEKTIYLWFSGLKNGMWNIYTCRIINGIQEPPRQIELDKTMYQSEHSFLPCVLFDGCFKMWYVGRNGENRRILYAQSVDGINWTDNQMVLDIGVFGDGDAYAADCPDVVRIKSGYAMVYGGGTSRGIHIAISTDGVHWRKKGQHIFRGNRHEDTYNYAFYPCFMSDRCTQCDSIAAIPLLFAGEDMNGNWTIQYHMAWDECINTDVLCNFSCSDWLKTYHEIQYISEKCCFKLEDANDTQNYYESDTIRQLKPSTNMVFLDKHLGIIYKFPLSRENAENEMKASLMLGKYLRIVPKKIQYIESETTVLLMPYLENAITLNVLAQTDIKRFSGIYRRVLYDCKCVFEENIVDRINEQIIYTGQTPELLKRWSENILCKFDKLKMPHLVSLHTGKEYNLASEIEKAQNAIMSNQSKLVFFSGDSNLHNILVTPDDIHHYIDMEYLGYFDIDYVVAKIIGSFFKHCAPMYVTRFEESNVISIDYMEKDTSLQGMLNSKYYADVFSNAYIDYWRVRAYILIKLHFRIATLTQDMHKHIELLAILLVVLDFFNEETL